MKRIEISKILFCFILQRFIGFPSDFTKIKKFIVSLLSEDLFSF